MFDTNSYRMARPKYSVTYTEALRTYSRALSRSKLRKNNNVVAKSSGVTTVQEDMETSSPEDVTITDSALFQKLSHRAAQLCHQIIGELKFNNALWYFDQTKNSRDRVAIKELRDKHILSHTEDTCIHFVNPDVIRKGNKLLVAANTAIITEHSRVCKEMIRPLNRKNIELNPLHIADVGE
jgi:hypothetical protein